MDISVYIHFIEIEFLQSKNADTLEKENEKEKTVETSNEEDIVYSLNFKIEDNVLDDKRDKSLHFFETPWYMCLKEKNREICMMSYEMNLSHAFSHMENNDQLNLYVLRKNIKSEKVEYLCRSELDISNKKNYSNNNSIPVENEKIKGRINLYLKNGTVCTNIFSKMKSDEFINRKSVDDTFSISSKLKAEKRNHKSEDTTEKKEISEREVEKEEEEEEEEENEKEKEYDLNTYFEYLIKQDRLLYWVYMDDNQKEQGPFNSKTIFRWITNGYFEDETLIRLVDKDTFYKLEEVVEYIEQDVLHNTNRKTAARKENNRTETENKEKQKTQKEEKILMPDIDDGEKMKLSDPKRYTSTGNETNSKQKETRTNCNFINLYSDTRHILKNIKSTQNTIKENKKKIRDESEERSKNIDEQKNSSCSNNDHNSSDNCGSSNSNNNNNNNDSDSNNDDNNDIMKESIETDNLYLQEKKQVYMKKQKRGNGTGKHLKNTKEKNDVKKLRKEIKKLKEEMTKLMAEGKFHLEQNRSSCYPVTNIMKEKEKEKEKEEKQKEIEETRESNREREREGEGDGEGQRKRERGEEDKRNTPQQKILQGNLQENANSNFSNTKNMHLTNENSFSRENESVSKEANINHTHNDSGYKFYEIFQDNMEDQKKKYMNDVINNLNQAQKCLQNIKKKKIASFLNKLIHISPRKDVINYSENEQNGFVDFNEYWEIKKELKSRNIPMNHINNKTSTIKGFSPWEKKSLDINDLRRSFRWNESKMRRDRKLQKLRQVFKIPDKELAKFKEKKKRRENTINDRNDKTKKKKVRKQKESKKKTKDEKRAEQKMRKRTEVTKLCFNVLRDNIKITYKYNLHYKQFLNNVMFIQYHIRKWLSNKRKKKYYIYNDTLQDKQKTTNVLGNSEMLPNIKCNKYFVHQKKQRNGRKNEKDLMLHNSEKSKRVCSNFPMNNKNNASVNSLQKNSLPLYITNLKCDLLSKKNGNTLLSDYEMFHNGRLKWDEENSFEKSGQVSDVFRKYEEKIIAKQKEYAKSRYEENESTGIFHTSSREPVFRQNEKWNDIYNKEKEKFDNRFLNLYNEKKLDELTNNSFADACEHSNTIRKKEDNSLYLNENQLNRKLGTWNKTELHPSNDLKIYDNYCKNFNKHTDNTKEKSFYNIIKKYKHLENREEMNETWNQETAQINSEPNHKRTLSNQMIIKEYLTNLVNDLHFDDILNEKKKSCILQNKLSQKYIGSYNREGGVPGKLTEKIKIGNQCKLPPSKYSYLNESRYKNEFNNQLDEGKRIRENKYVSNSSGINDLRKSTLININEISKIPDDYKKNYENAFSIKKYEFLKNL